MKQRIKRILACMLAIVAAFTAVFSNVTPAMAVSAEAALSYWDASAKDVGEVSEIKPDFYHGKILYGLIDGHSAYCMNFGLQAYGGQLMNSYENASTSMTAKQEKLLAYCMYFGYSAPDTNTPSSSQNDQFIATQSMVWIIEADLFNTNEGDSAAKKLCDSAPDADAAYKYYKKLKSDMLLSFEAARPSFASQTKSGANTYVLKWNESKARFEYTFTDENKVLSNFDFDVSGFSITKNGNTMTVYTDKVNTTGATGTFTSNIGQVDTTTGCVYWLTGKEGYQEFVSEQPQADPITAYIKVKTENIGYGEITKTDKSTGKHLAGAVYGIYSDSSCKTLVDTMKTDKNGYAKSKALGAGTYYVKEIDAPNGYVRSNKVHTLMIKAGQTKEIELTDVEQKGSLTIYKEGEVLIGWNGSNFTYEKRKLAGAEFKVTAGADIYCADGTKAYNKGDIVSEGLVTGKDGNAVLSDLHLGTYIVTETRSIDGYTVNGKPKTVTIGAYVLIDESEIKSNTKRAQINLAGVEMNLLLAGVLMILATFGNFLGPWKVALLFAALQNVFLVLMNLAFTEGLDGEHALSSLFGGFVVDAAKANLSVLFDRQRRVDYFAVHGICGAANICVSLVILVFQFIVPLVVVADISIWIGALFQ